MGDAGSAADLSRGPEAWSPVGLLKVPGSQRCPGSDQSNKITLRPRTRRASQSQFFPGRQGRKEGRKKGGGKGDRGEGKKGGKRVKRGKREEQAELSVLWTIHMT